MIALRYACSAALGLCALAQSTVAFADAPAEAQANPAPAENPTLAPSPPRFEAPAFGKVEPAGETDPAAEEASSDDLAAELPKRPSRLVVRVDAGGRYRRLYTGDIAAFQLSLAVGARIRPVFHASGFILGALGETNHGLDTRFFSFGSDLSFPLAAVTDGFLGRLTPGIRLHLNYSNIERITRPEPIWGFGLGADLQLSVDVYRQEQHGVYIAMRGGIEGYLSEGEGFSLFGGYGMWGGEAVVGFRY